MGLIRHCTAENWPAKIYFATAGMVWLVFLVKECSPNRQLLTDWRSLLAFIGLVIAGLIVSVGIALVCSPLFLWPIYRLQAYFNGAPFSPGEIVRILNGPARGREVQVYSQWQGNSIRVELGDAEKNAFKDIYSDFQLLRISPKRRDEIKSASS